MDHFLTDRVLKLCRNIPGERSAPQNGFYSRLTIVIRLTHWSFDHMNGLLVRAKAESAHSER